MRKLSATDAMFLYNETPRMPMHIASVQVFELPHGQTVDSFVSGLKQFLLARLHRVPYLTSRLRETPLGLDHPVWARDPAFDIANHVSMLEVPAPGGQAQLEATIAALHEVPLDRSRPLWDIIVLSGLEGNRIAYYNRMHHACIDGVAGQAVQMLLMETSPDIACGEAPARGDDSAEDADADLYALWEAGWRNIFASQSDRQARGLDTALAAAQATTRVASPVSNAAHEFETAPVTRFNRAIGAERSYATGELDLATVKAVAQAHGATLNDVFLAVCGGALRTYLAAVDELPEATLQAGCPVSLRATDDARLDNQISMMRVALGTHVENPLERLAFVRFAAENAKDAVATVAPALPGNVAEPGLPNVMRALAAAADGWASVGVVAPSPVNVVISNVPGPREPLFSNGARMLTHYPVSVPAHGLGLNITVQSYAGTLFYGVTACRRALPDAAALRDQLHGQFEALLALSPGVVAAESQATGGGAATAQRAA